MTQPAKVQEPSMEEILASIRRIIADDDAGKAAGEPQQAADAAAELAAPSGVQPAPRPVAVLQNQPPDQHQGDTMPADTDSAPQDEGADILDLTEAMTAPAAAAVSEPGFRTIDRQSDVVFSDRPLMSVAEPVAHAAEEDRKPDPQPLDRSLMSPSTSAAVDSAFNSLANTVLGQNARTLDDLVKEMLRPMLKTWLDDNLPSLVERIVRAEIERVSRGRM
jgi:cell pole-organizing protein PopZ